jgi:1-acyl-sn-glycerol-3-phosphate acyltransferase
VTAAPHQLPPNPPGLDRHRSPLSRLVYRLCWLGGKWVQLNTLRVRVLNREMLDTPGGYQLACSHLSHLEPFVLSMVARRPIDWMTRIEFYRRPMISWLLTRLSAIPVRRQGCSASAVRTAIQRVKAGRVVGICPEGGVLTGSESACRGGRVKRGAGLIAVRTGRPVIPCVILGTHELNRVGPWLPFRRGRLWFAFGQPIHPPADASSRRAAREAVAVELERSFQSLFRQLVDTYGLDADELSEFRSPFAPAPAESMGTT